MEKESSDPTNTIKRLSDSNLILPILAYIAIQCANFGLGVWKCGAMGLLPTASSDWLAFLEPRYYNEIVSHVL